MQIEYMERIGTWRDVADAARTTIGMDPGTGDPSDEWKRSIILSEHSPIRIMTFHWKWTDLPSWVSTHFVRHHVGITHYVKTQRSDRTGIERDDLPQSAPVTHECYANVQALINIARVRLCGKASKETMMAFIAVVNHIRKIDPIVAEAMKPNCEYRNMCSEFESCGWWERVKNDKR